MLRNQRGPAAFHWGDPGTCLGLEGLGEQGFPCQLLSHKQNGFGILNSPPSAPKRLTERSRPCGDNEGPCELGARNNSLWGWLETSAFNIGKSRSEISL